ncbi:MAG: helix-turn-helix transcriptional regulator [Clostridia bacterium]|nr:helix-turn-helix transcriptional regulator [Clostridia bacterium]
MLKLKAYRLRNDYTQRYIAYKIGVSQQTVVKWEKGQAMPSVSHLMQLSSLIGCSIEELIA